MRTKLAYNVNGANQKPPATIILAYRPIHTCQPKLNASSDPVPLTFDPDTVQRWAGGDPGAGGALAA